MVGCVVVVVVGVVDFCVAVVGLEVMALVAVVILVVVTEHISTTDVSLGLPSTILPSSSLRYQQSV